MQLKTNYIEIIGYVAAICTSISFIPQLIKIIKTKAVRDVSIIMYIIMLIGSLLWSLYGVINGSCPITYSGLATSTFVILILIFKILWNKN